MCVTLRESGTNVDRIEFGVKGLKAPGFSFSHVFKGADGKPCHLQLVSNYFHSVTCLHLTSVLMMNLP